MDERSISRVLSADEFTRLTTDEKLAYIDQAIKILLAPRPDNSAATPSRSNERTRNEET